MFQSLYNATWLWVVFLLLFLVQGLHSSPQVQLILFKIGQYYIIGSVAIQLLIPASHPILRALLFDLTTRTFLFIEAAELLWFAWSAWRTGTYQHQPLSDEEMTLGSLIWYAVSALLYLIWIILGVSFAFTLTPGM